MFKIKVQKFAAELYAIAVKSAKYVITSSIATDYLRCYGGQGIDYEFKK